MIKIAICDDNLSIIEALKKICLSFFTDGNVQIFSFTSGEKLLQSNNRYDFIFMDIELENMSGLETIREIRKTDLYVLVVIISGFSGYKFDAFSLHLFDFLDKPIQVQQVVDVLEKAVKYLKKPKENSYITIKTKDQYLNLQVDDIFYFSFEGRKIKVYCVDAMYTFYENISELAKRIHKYHFSMPHQSFVVNLRYIVELNRSEVVLHNSHKIPISRYKSKGFINEYLRFIGEGYE